MGYKMCELDNKNVENMSEKITLGEPYNKFYNASN